MAKHREMAGRSVQAKRVIGGALAALFAVAAMLGTFSDSAARLPLPGGQDSTNVWKTQWGLVRTRWTRLITAATKSGKIG